VFEILLPDCLPGTGFVRRIARATGPAADTFAVWLGDHECTHSVRWVRADGTELLRRDVPAFPGAPDPALSGDLQLLAFLPESGGGPVRAERPFEPARGHRLAVPHPFEHYEEPNPICCLGISIAGDALRVGRERGEIDDFALAESFLGGAPDGSELRRTNVHFEIFPRAHAFGHGIAPPPYPNGPTDLYIVAAAGYAYRAYRDTTEEIAELASNVPPRAVAVGTTQRGVEYAVAHGHTVEVQSGSFAFPRPRGCAFGSAADGTVTGVAFAPDGSALAACTSTGRVHFWDCAAQLLRETRDWGIGPLGGIAYDATGARCVAGGANGRLMFRAAG